MNDKPTVLIIDDDKTERDLYKAWLKNHPDNDYDIIEAENGTDGYNAFIDHKPDCVLLDFLMPDINGFDFLVKIKKFYSQEVPIIFFTQYHQKGIDEDALSLGAQLYLNKDDLSSEGLHEAIELIIRNRHILH